MNDYSNEDKVLTEGSLVIMWDELYLCLPEPEGVDVCGPCAFRYEKEKCEMSKDCHDVYFKKINLENLCLMKKML